MKKDYYAALDYMLNGIVSTSLSRPFLFTDTDEVDCLKGRLEVEIVAKFNISQPEVKTFYKPLKDDGYIFDALQPTFKGIAFNGSGSYIEEQRLKDKAKTDALYVSRGAILAAIFSGGLLLFEVVKFVYSLCCHSCH